MTIQSDLQTVSDRVAEIERKVDSNHTELRGEIAGLARELNGRLWQVGGSVIGSVLIAAILQVKFG